MNNLKGNLIQSKAFYRKMITIYQFAMLNNKKRFMKKKKKKNRKFKTKILKNKF